MELQLEYEQKLSMAKTDQERVKLERQLEKIASELMLSMLWTTTVVDITNTVYETCQMVFFDQSVDKKTRAARAKGVRKLGEIWMQVAMPAGGSKSAQMLYEDAAFCAMVETARRNDDAVRSHSSRDLSVREVV
jgi:X-domain of DnaJ-containing